MSDITYPPEMLPRAGEDGADVIIVDPVTGEHTTVGYERGDGRVVYLGELPESEHFPAGKYAVIEFPSGPPNLPISIIWNGVPVTITPRL